MLWKNPIPTLNGGEVKESWRGGREWEYIMLLTRSGFDLTAYSYDCSNLTVKPHKQMVPICLVSFPMSECALVLEQWSKFHIYSRLFHGRL